MNAVRPILALALLAAAGATAPPAQAASHNTKGLPAWDQTADANRSTLVDGTGTAVTPATSAGQTTTNTELGGLTETAPATDTASSGLNGRLQRLAQRITSLITALGSPAQDASVDGLETLVTSTNTKLDTLHTDVGTTLHADVDGLETLVTSTNTKLDTLHTDLGLTQAPITPAAATATKTFMLGCENRTTLPTFTNTQQGAVQCTTRGGMFVAAAQGYSPADSQSLASAFGAFTSGDGTAKIVAVYPWYYNGTSADMVRGDANGALVQPWAFAASRWSYAAATGGIDNTTTAVTIKASAGGSVRNYITACQIDHDTLGAATELVIRDGAAGTVLARKKLQTTAVEGQQISFGAPLRGTAATLVEVATLTGVTGGVFVNCQGFTGS